MTRRNKVRQGMRLAASLLPLILLCLPVRGFQISGTGVSLSVPSPSFALQWIHSVEQESWVEHYETDGSGLILTTTRFKTFGAGVPSDGKAAALKDGFVEYRIGRKMEELRLVVSPLVRSTIYAGKSQLPLYRMTAPYNELVIRPTLLPAASWLNYAFHPDQGGILL